MGVPVGPLPVGPAYFEERCVPLTGVLTDRGREFCGGPKYHQYELYLAIAGISHFKTQSKNPQGNPICDEFHQTLFDA
jgi:hypothetical protein